MNAPLPSVTAQRPDVPVAVDRVLARMAAKRPEDRPASMAEVLALLEGLRPRAVTRAPLVARGLALGIDLVVYSVLIAAVQWGLTRLEPWVRVTWLEALGGVLAVGLAVATQFGMEARHGGSAGKLLLHLRVLSDTGGRPRRRALLARLLLRFPALPYLLVPSEAMPHWLDLGVAWLQGLAFLAAIVAFLVTRGRTLTDLVTRTLVAYRLPEAGPRP
jgi:hypothetical protein